MSVRFSLLRDGIIMSVRFSFSRDGIITTPVRSVQFV